MLICCIIVYVTIVFYVKVTIFTLPVFMEEFYMRKNRKQKNISTIAKLERKIFIKIISSVALIVFFFYALLFLLSAIIYKTSVVEMFFEHWWIAIFAYVCTLIILCLICKPTVSAIVIDEQQKKLNKSLVEQNLHVNVPVKISLINTRNNVYSDFFKNLQQDEVLSFYAILGKDNCIAIYTIEDNGNEILLDVINKEEFSKYCELV